MNIVGRRQVFYRISIVAVAIAIAALGLFKLNLGIDFTGGVSLEVKGQLDEELVQEIAQASEVQVITSTNETSIIQLKSDNPDLAERFRERGFEVLRFDQIGSSISTSLGRNALVTLALMLGLILGYMAFTFRHVPSEIGALNFAIAATLALLHDSLIILGAYALLGQFFNVQIDTQIITAILTIIGFSIHDTIVVFDRVRENVATKGENFAESVNQSLNEVIERSLNTAIVVLLVLAALVLFSDSNIRFFSLALLIGMVSGTYSSIFIAAPLLVSLSERKHLYRKK